MSENLNVLNATISRWLRTVENHTLRERIFMAKAKKEGVFQSGHTGVDVRWKERDRDLPLQARGDGTPVEYITPDYLQEYVTDVRGYVLGLKLSEKQQILNTGDEAIVKYMDDLAPTAKDSISKEFAGELLNRDGSATGYEDYINGLGTIISKGKFTTPSLATDQIAVPGANSYAGLSMVLGNSSGSSWTAALGTGNFPNSTLARDYPNGQGTANYNPRSPLCLVIDSSNWGTDSREASDNLGICIRHGTHWQRRLRGGAANGPQLYLVSSDLWLAYQAYQEAKFRNLVPHEEGRDLGFPETLKQDSVMIAPEYDMPAATFYGLNFKHMKVCRWVNPPGVSQDSQTMFYSTGWKTDEKTGDKFLRFGFWGNTKLWPGGFVVGHTFGVA